MPCYELSKWLSYTHLEPKSRNLAHMFLKSMSMTVYHHIRYSRFVNENKDICLSDDHIWKCQNLNSLPYLLNLVSYFVQIFRIFVTYYFLSNGTRMNVEIIHI